MHELKKYSLHSTVLVTGPGTVALTQIPLSISTTMTPTVKATMHELSGWAVLMTHPESHQDGSATHDLSWRPIQTARALLLVFVYLCSSEVSLGPCGSPKKLI